MKRLKVKFQKSSGLTWESVDFPDGIGVLETLVDPGKRSYWDKFYLENRGGSTMLPIQHLKIVMVYNNPSGSSPNVSDHVVDSLDLSTINHAEIPIVDWDINMDLLSGYDKIDLNELRKRSVFKWAGLNSNDPDVIRAALEDFEKSGSDGTDQYGSNPKYGRVPSACFAANLSAGIIMKRT